MIPTPFGPMPVFDAHAHFFGRSFLAGLGQQLGVAGPDAAADVARRLGWEAPPADPADVGRKWVAEMDRHGVDRMVSIHTLPGDLDSAVAGVQAAGGRLVGYVMVNPLAEGAAAAVRRAAAAGFRGVALFPAMFRFPVAGDAAYAVLQVADEHGMVVFVHCGVLKVGFRTKLGLPCVFDSTLANPLALQRPAAEFPRLRFVLPHLGSGYLRELLMLADQSPNVHADTSGVGGWAKYLAGNPPPTTALRQAVDVMGAGRLLFGTDSTFFPRGWRRDVFEQQVRLFEEAGLTADQVRQVLGGNLERLLG